MICAACWAIPRIIRHSGQASIIALRSFIVCTSLQLYNNYNNNNITHELGSAMKICLVLKAPAVTWTTASGSGCRACTTVVVYRPVMAADVSDGTAPKATSPVTAASRPAVCGSYMGCVDAIRRACSIFWLQYWLLIHSSCQSMILHSRSCVQLKPLYCLVFCVISEYLQYYTTRSSR